MDLPLRPRAPGDLESDPREPVLDGEARAAAGGVASDAPAGAQSRVAATRRPRRRVGLWFFLLLVGAVLVWLFFPGPPEAELSENRLDFGTVRVGKSSQEAVVSLINRGERKLKIDSLAFVPATGGDYRVLEEECSGRRLATGESCEVRLRFEPVESGDRSTRLLFQGNDRRQPGVDLAAIATAPRLGLAPSAVSFGVVPLQAETSAREVTLSNVGTATLEFRRIRIAGPARGDFSRSRRCPSSRLEPGEACGFEIRFEPSVSGDRRADLVVESDALGSPFKLALSGTGFWNGPPLDPAAKTLDLGEQLVGERSTAKTVVLVNRTGGTVSVDRTSVEGSSSFAVVDDKCRGRSVLSGGSCSLAVTFLPIVDGDARATLRLAAAGASEEAEVELRGRGVTPRLEAGTDALDFEQQRVGFESATRRVELRNTGTATLRLRSIELTDFRGSEGSEFVVVSNPCADRLLAPAKSCSVAIAFNPAQLGARTGTLAIEPGFGLAGLRIELAGEGVASSLAVRPGSLDFGQVYLGRVEEKTLTLTNEGSARLMIRGLRFEGGDAAAFGLDQSGCALEAGLAPGAGCRFQIGFEPQAERRYGGQLVVEYNGPDSPARVELRAVGRAPAPVFRASTTALDLGSAEVGGRGEIGTIVISNPGAAWLRLIGISVRGEHAEDFQLVAGTCDGVSALAPSGSCTIGVRLAPATPGRRRGAILVRHGAASGSATVALSGDGVAPPVSAVPDLSEDGR